MVRVISLLVVSIFFFHSKSIHADGYITGSNRSYHTGNVMRGGWAPHLRGIMRNSKDELWFVADTGTDVYNNNYLRYFKKVGSAWTLIGTQLNVKGGNFRVSQNVASVLLQERYIFSYGTVVDGTGASKGFIEECYFDTFNPSYKACNVVNISGRPYLLPTNSNYIGAAVDPDGISRIVWWTTAGVNGAGGSMSYMWNFGGGWNGPVTQHLSGFNDIGYMNGVLKDRSKFVGVAQLFYGDYSTQNQLNNYYAGMVSITLGQAHKLSLLWPKTADYKAGDRVRSSDDLYVDPVSKSVHVLANNLAGKLSYFFNLNMDIPAAGLTASQSFTDSVRARFLASDGKLNLIIGSASKNNYRVLQSSSNLSSAVNWDQAKETNLSVPHSTFGSTDAIFIEGPQYQSTKTKGFNFATCGNYNAFMDGYIYYFSSLPSK